MSSLLSTLNALAISLLSVLVRLLACRPCVCPTNVAELGPFELLMQAFVICLSAENLAVLHLQVTCYLRDMGQHLCHVHWPAEKPSPRLQKCTPLGLEGLAASCQGFGDAGR